MTAVCPNHPDKKVHCRGLCKNCYDKLLKLENPEYAESQRKNCKTWSDARKSVPVEQTKECLFCKKPFTTTKGTKVYCSPNCSHLRWSNVPANKERMKIHSREKRKGAWARMPTEYGLFSKSKQRAKKLGWEFSLQLGDVVVPDKCPLLGIPLIKNKKHVGPNSPSLDRIDSSKGYVPGNVWVISHRANTAKNNLTFAELKTLVENLEEKLTESKLHETRKG